MSEDLVAVEITTNHDEFKKPPVTPMFQISMRKQLRRNLVYIGDAKNIVNEKAALGSLKPREQVELNQLYNSSLAANQHLISAVGPKERIQDNLNLKTRSKVQKATEDAGIFGHAVWTTSERIKREKEARKMEAERENFMRREFESTISSHGDHHPHWHQNMTNPVDTDARHSFGSYILPGPQQRLFVANPNSRNTSTAGSLPDVRQSVGSHIPPGPQQGLFVTNPNSQNTSTEGSLQDVQHSSGLYIPPGPQQIPYVMNSNSRNISTEGIPPSSRMGSDLSLSQQTAMTGSSGLGHYPKSGSVNTASLEDDGTHFSMGSRASGSSEMYQLDPSTGYYSGEPGSPRYPAMYNSGQEYYHNQTQMAFPTQATPYSSYPPPPPHASTSTDRHGMYHHRSEDPGRHQVQHDDAHKPHSGKSAHPEARAQRH
ncbi:hypothetical protein F5876DRAFT_76846 [Lentinula aff. lateritia]|uniref:Uncharacterized protein n=1 Tax=Lentinula aff. lateritia TaxID=2804960 RepID=A0ACC1U0C0_9AGAR|nr:hypothetical protein F5876DRAFT_76846 [Lentinula aff. lateritia]